MYSPMCVDLHFKDTSSVLVSCDCCIKLPQTWQLHRNLWSHFFWRQRSNISITGPKPRWQQVHVCSEGSRGESVFPSSSFWWLLVFQSPHHLLCVFSSSVSSSVSLWTFVVTPRYPRSSPHPKSFHLIATGKTHFPYTVTFPGSRN